MARASKPALLATSTVRAFGGAPPPVGSEEAPNEELASVRRTNRTYSFPVSGFHERAFAICSEGISETRLTSLNSVRNRLVGYSFHAALRHHVTSHLRLSEICNGVSMGLVDSSARA